MNIQFWFVVVESRIIKSADYDGKIMTFFALIVGPTSCRDRSKSLVASFINKVKHQRQTDVRMRHKAHDGLTVISFRTEKFFANIVSKGSIVIREYGRAGIEGCKDIFLGGILRSLFVLYSVTL